MIRHMFISPIKEGANEERVNEFIRELLALKGKIPEIIAISVGKNLGLFDKRVTVASVADFANEQDWKTYMENPDHLELAKMATEIFDIPNSAIAQIED